MKNLAPKVILFIVLTVLFLEGCGFNVGRFERYKNDELEISLVLDKSERICNISNAGSLHGLLISLDSSSCEQTKKLSGRYATISVSINPDEFQHISQISDRYCDIDGVNIYKKDLIKKYFHHLSRQYQNNASCIKSLSTPFGKKIEIVYFFSKEASLDIYSKIYTIRVSTFLNNFETDGLKIQRLFSEL
jgi:hypothetical protein